MTERMNVDVDVAQATPAATQTPERKPRETDWFMQARGPIQPENVPGVDQHDQHVAGRLHDVTAAIQAITQAREIV